MNLPTKLTVLRIVLAPIYFLVFMIPVWCGGFQISTSILLVLIFAVAELTDFLDGYIARKYDMVTDIGKVLDPYSDVIMRVTYFFCFVHFGIMPMWMLLVIVYRELSIGVVRNIAMQRGIALAANIWGKSKAVMYAVSSIFGLVYVALVRIWPSIETSLGGNFFKIFVVALFAISTLASVVSFVTYAVPVFKKKA